MIYQDHGVSDHTFFVLWIPMGRDVEQRLPVRPLSPSVVISEDS